VKLSFTSSPRPAPTERRGGESPLAGRRPPPPRAPPEARSGNNGARPRCRGLGGPQGRGPNPSARAAHGPTASAADPADAGDVPPRSPAPGGSPAAPDPRTAYSRGHRAHGRVPEPLPPQGKRRSLKLAGTAFRYGVIPYFRVDSWLILVTDVLRGKFISDVGIMPSLEDEQRRERVVRELGKVMGVRVLGLKGFCLQY
jgi:hypothetical protein